MIKFTLSRIKLLAPSILLLSAFPLFFIGVPSIESSLIYSAAWNFGHIIFFILLVLQINKIYPLKTLKSGFYVSFLVFMVGGSIELIQETIGRDGTWDDVYLNLAGAWIGFIWVQPPNLKLWIARILVLGLVAPYLIQVSLLIANHIHALKVFPRIADFESKLELYGYSGSSEFEITNKYHTHGGHSLKLILKVTKYSGINIKRNFSDWSPYKQLGVDIFLPDKNALDIVIRVNDIVHDVRGSKDNDRYNKYIRLKYGWNYISIPMTEIESGPADRLMDLSSVVSIIIYTSRLSEERIIYLDNLRLE